MTRICCKKCGLLLALHIERIIRYNGNDIPIDGIDSIVFKCPCKRLRHYYIRENEAVKIERKSITGTF
jgi:RNase P subunit RPR2